MSDQLEAESSQSGHARRASKGTIDLLVHTRQVASDEYTRAQRAEKAYRARKNATLARTSLNETKTHFAEGFKHLGLGLKGIVTIIKGVPYIVGERKDTWRKNRESKQLERAETMRKKLDERIRRAGSEEGGSDKASEGGEKI
ncbi:hypothetical protein F4808DRAFT_456337 [Astrocystis sublimbata]|nr:hypothetical protein F4808DRAFT_456337 [Astrocystis sublimbata]